MLLLQSGRRPGTYAKERFRHGARAWRRRVLRAPQVGLVAAATVTLAGGLLVEGVAKLVFGFVAGAFAMALVALRDLIPPHVERWRRGWEGERRTGRVLRTLERRGWFVVHDVELPDESANLDHVVVGDAGVFLLETKSYAGECSLHDDALRIVLPDDPSEPPRTRRLGPRIRRAAADLKGRIQTETGDRVWVHAVVVLWAAFPQGIAVVDGVVYLHGSHLAEWLESQPPSGSPFHPAAIAGAVRRIAVAARP